VTFNVTLNVSGVPAKECYRNKNGRGEEC
jgi:hypothetical protein